MLTRSSLTGVYHFRTANHSGLTLTEYIYVQSYLSFFLFFYVHFRLVHSVASALSHSSSDSVLFSNFSRKCTIKRDDFSVFALLNLSNICAANIASGRGSCFLFSRRAISLRVCVLCMFISLHLDTMIKLSIDLLITKRKNVTTIIIKILVLLNQNTISASQNEPV